MPERPWKRAPGAAPLDRAALYAQAQIGSARYGDFSASRQQLRRQFDHHHQPQMLSLPSAEQAPMPALAAPGQETTPNRWYALHSVFSPAPAENETVDTPSPPMVAVLSLAGGVGKTCLVATLGRALSGLGEQVLLVDMSACALLPFYFGSCAVKPGVVRTFSSPVHSGQRDAPVRLLSLDVECHSGANGEPDPLSKKIVRGARGAGRVLVDVGIAHRGLPDALLSLRPSMLAPILPDMSSLACLASLEAQAGHGSQILYLLNQFDASLPLHVDVRAMLQRQLGSRLLPFVLHRSPSVSEALAEGMTVIDYAPSSEIAEDYRELAAWLRTLAAPAPANYGGMRWTER